MLLRKKAQENFPLKRKMQSYGSQALKSLMDFDNLGQGTA